MPVLLPMAAGLAAVPLAAWAGSYFGAAWEATAMKKRQGSFSHDPVAIPPPDQIWRLHQQLDRGGNRRMSHGSADTFLRAWGIDIIGASEDWNQVARAAAWRAAFEASKLLPSLELAHAAYAKRLIKDDELAYIRSQHVISECDWAEYHKVWLEHLPPMYAVGLWVRGLITEDELTEVLDRASWFGGWPRQKLKEAAQRVFPTASDLLLFLRKDTFNEALVARYGYDEDWVGTADEPGYGERALAWFKKIGLGWKISEEPGLPPSNATVAQLYSRAGYTEISPTQAYTMLHRLRPGKPGVQNPTTLKDVDFALRLADYTPFWRKRLVEISYAVPGRIDIRNAHFLGAIKDRAELVSRYQDLGYSPADSDFQARFTERITARRKGRDVLGLTRQKIGTLYTVGVISRRQARELLGEIGLSGEEADAALLSLDLDTSLRRTRAIIQSVRRRYTLGDLDTNAAFRLLTSFGIGAERANQYVTEWELAREVNKLEKSPATLTRWLILGTINLAEFERRLLNLGWARAEIERILASAVAAQKDTPPPALKVPKGKGGRGGRSTASELSRADIRELLEKELINRAQADVLLRNLRYDEPDRDLLLRLWESNGEAK